MSKCRCVFRAGQPSSVQIGNTPYGDRTAVLTYRSGPRPGIYRFLRGSLTSMDRVAEQPPPPGVAKEEETGETEKSRAELIAGGGVGFIKLKA